MKILQICNTLAAEDGGPARNAAELHASLRVLTHDACQLWSVGPQDREAAGDDGDRLTQSSMRVFFLPSSGIVRLLRNLRRSKVVILHGYYLWWTPLAVLAAKASRCRVLLTHHGSLTEYQESHSRLRKKLFKILVGAWMDRLVDRFVAGSEPEASMLRESGRRHVSVAGVGTNMPSEENLAVGGVSHPLQLISVSRIAPKKRIDTMIRSVQCLMANGTSVRLRVAGQGVPGLRAELEALTVELDVAGSVEFVGHLDDQGKHSLFREADIFLLPSDDENFGIGLAEALAHSVPSVVTSAVGAAQGMSPHSGRVVPDSDPHLVAAAVAALAAVEDFQSLRDSARRDAERLYGWDGVARRWVDIAERATLGRCARPRE